MQNRQFNLPTLGSWLTIMPWHKTWFGFVHVCAESSYHCTFSQGVTWLVFVLEILIFWIREIIPPWQCVVSSHRLYIWNTRGFFFFFFPRDQQCKLYFCSLICFTSCMYLVLFSPKKGTRTKIMGYCLSASNLFLRPRTQNSCVSSAKCSTAAQCLVYYHISGLLNRHGEAFERNKHQGRGSFMLNFGLGSCRTISKKKQDWCTVWGFCRESYQSTAVSPDSLQLITDLLIQPNHSCMENQRRLGSV